jgi:hypothetical protein
MRSTAMLNGDVANLSASVVALGAKSAIRAGWYFEKWQALFCEPKQ